MGIGPDPDRESVSVFINLDPKNMDPSDPDPDMRKIPGPRPADLEDPFYYFYILNIYNLAKLLFSFP